MASEKKKRTLSPAARERHRARSRARYVPKKGRRRQWTGEEDAVVAANTDAAAADILGRSVSAVRARRKATGTPNVTPEPPPRARDDADLLALYEECGGSYKAMGERLGVSKQRAAQLVARAERTRGS